MENEGRTNIRDQGLQEFSQRINLPTVSENSSGSDLTLVPTVLVVSLWAYWVTLTRPIRNNTVTL